MHSSTIGILGGMGPRATAYFEDRLLSKLTGPDQQLPRMVTINDGGIPDRTAFLCGDGADPLPRLRRSALALLACRPDVVCMPCNTAHAAKILGRLQATCHLPIIDMPAAALAQARARGCKSVLIAGTEGTRVGGVYEDRAHGIPILYPNAQDQAMINTLIAETKTRGFVQDNRDKLAAIAESTVADAIILACTELSMLNRNLHVSVVVVDALEALADACIKAITQTRTVSLH